MSALSEDVRKLLNRYNVKPKKKRGQSFLFNHSIAKEIVELANLSQMDVILEIGGGLGILTRLIAESAKHVHVIEVDHGLVTALHDVLKDFSNVNIIEGDALTVDLPSVNKIIANLPYSISSEITFRILKEIQFETAILMYQKEFASRLVALPGTSDYSRLTVNVQYHANIEEVLDVPATMFYPLPAVDSTVVRMTRRLNGPFARDDEIFHWMVGGIYPYPNKNLRKVLRIWFRNQGLEKDLADEVLRRAGNVVSGKERLRSITLENLIFLSDVFLDLIQESEIADPRV
ncbi:MAG: 16S rRNA (adenine(1518)-N(6)/adenine(1519)-N(6))-dimethyltransferase RsmA [Candidatus Thorarchaeota archaeon]